MRLQLGGLRRITRGTRGSQGASSARRARQRPHHHWRKDRSMAATSENIELTVEGEQIAGTLLSPHERMPGILFVHGWGGSQTRDMMRAKGIAGLGCVCLTFDLRGHEKTLVQQ